MRGKMDSPNNTNNTKPWYKKWRVWIITLLIISVSTLVITPYIYIMFPTEHMKDRYRDFPYIATISITNFSDKEGRITARELIEARTDWIHNQKSDWDKHGRRRYYTLDLSQNNEISVIFGYEEGFDINAFANEITKAADLHFIDLNNNHIIYNADIISARYAYQGATQAYDVIIEITEEGMQKFLVATETWNGTDNYIQVDFKGSIPSDYFTIEATTNNTVIIKNISAAEALVKLIELKDVPDDLKVELKIE